MGAMFFILKVTSQALKRPNVALLSSFFNLLSCFFYYLWYDPIT